jgi:hypothetical protein
MEAVVGSQNVSGYQRAIAAMSPAANAIMVTAIRNVFRLNRVGTYPELSIAAIAITSINHIPISTIQFLSIIAAIGGSQVWATSPFSLAS